MDTLDVPVPIIAGITETSFNRLIDDYNLSETFIDSMTWVFLDNCKDGGQMSNPSWRPEIRDIKWSIYEGNITRDEQDWFILYDELRKLEDLHNDFRSQGIN